MENKENQSVEIDLRKLLPYLWQRAWIILLSGMLAATLAVSYALFFVAPTYAASTRFYVNNNYEGGSSVSSSQIAAALNLVETYMVILESRSVLMEVAEQTGYPYTYKQLERMISAESVNNTEIFQVDVVCTNSEHALGIANAIVEILPNKIASVVKGSSVGVVDPALSNDAPVGPSYQRYGVIGALLGLVISVIVIVITKILDTSISSEDYLAEVYGHLPLLAVIPGAQSTKGGYYKGNYVSTQNRQRVRKSGGAK